MRFSQIYHAAILGDTATSTAIDCPFLFLKISHRRRYTASLAADFTGAVGQLIYNLLS